MFDATTEVADRIRHERDVLRGRKTDRRQRHLQHQVESLHRELEREHEARRALADAIGNTRRDKRRHGLLRLLLIGGAAYVLGTHAGRERYDAMAGWVRGIRDRSVTTARDVREEAVHTAGQVRDVALDTARTVGEDVKNTAAQVRANAARGARQVGDETDDAGERLKKELAPATDAVDV
jgi:hypothetical protein